MSKTTTEAAELRQILATLEGDVVSAVRGTGGIQARTFNSHSDPITYALERIETVLAQHDKTVEQAALKTYLEGYQEPLKTLRPARPEDLSMSQWYGLVEAMDAALQSVEEDLAALQTNQPEEGEHE